MKNPLPTNTRNTRRAFAPKASLTAKTMRPVTHLTPAPRWSAAGAAFFLGALLTQNLVSAAIIDSGPVNIDVPNTFLGLYLDFATGEMGTFGTAGFDLNLYNVNTGNLFFGFATSGVSGAGVSLDGTSYAVLTPGATVSSASLFVDRGFPAAMETWRAGATDGYLGFSFSNETTNALNYGYLQLNTTGPNGYPANITRIVYEDTGGPITVPEPASASLLAIVAVGVTALRRRRLPAPGAHPAPALLK